MDISVSNLLFLMIGLLMGFICGYMIDPRRIQELKGDMQVIKSIARNKKQGDKRNLGTIKFPNAQKLYERGTVVEATKDAMRETLSRDPYINENYTG